MSVQLRFDGLAELRAALRQLPEHLTGEAAQIVEAHAVKAQGDVVQGYPQGPTGNLKRRVTLGRQQTSRISVKAVVSSRAPHAWIFEKGTRQRSTTRGWNRGRMPAASDAEAMLPKVIRIRRDMIAALVAMVRRAGFTVTT